MDGFRNLPSVDEVLRGAAAPLLSSYPRPLVLAAVRGAIERHREAVDPAAGNVVPGRAQTEARSRVVVTEDDVRSALDALVAPYLRRVINATGVVLHTNLGRAPLSKRVLDRVVECGRGYVNLEYDLEERSRGSRSAAYAPLLTALSGAEAALAVNNNAAAMLLALGALCAGGEVIVSRGELVEIGGSFRVPDVLSASGARLCEVGTTNKTRLADYQAAINPDTRAILRVHRSNFAIVGFTEEPAASALVELAHERGLPAIFDLGSGALLDLAPFGLAGEVSVPAAVQAGFDVVAFSADKLLGGPQAGLIVGAASVIETLQRHPLYRAMRLDRLRLAALEETLRIYREGIASVRAHVPALEMLTGGPSELGARAAKLALLIETHAGARGFAATVVLGESMPGGGSYPLARLQTHTVAVRHPRLSADDLEAALRRATPPILCRIAEGAVLFDPRTLQDGDDHLIARALEAVPVPARSRVGDGRPA